MVEKTRASRSNQSEQTCWVFFQPIRRKTKTNRDLGYVCFTALGAGYMFSRAWQVACFPALTTGFMFSRAWHQLNASVSSSDWFIALFPFAVVTINQM